MPTTRIWGACAVIRFENVSMTYHIRRFRKDVLRDVSFVVPPRSSLGICGANGAGKSTLLRLMAGVEHPTTGRVTREMSVSWPIGYSSAFQASLTGADNVRFIARIYRRPEEELLAYVESFAQLGAYFRQPVKTYSAGMSARLAFGVSLAIDFDCYLVDEVTGAGDERFRQRCRDELIRRRDHAAMVLVSHDAHTLREYCTAGAVLRDQKLTFYDTIDEAIDVHVAYQSEAA
jgi:capsular polysaccharide transport system ATP-binding protein